MTKKDSQRNKYLLKKYGISLLTYHMMLLRQGSVCALCGKPPKRGKNLHVEHSHKTGRVRALCCYFCNRRRIGQLTIEWTRRILAYLEKYDVEVKDV